MSNVKVTVYKGASTQQAAERAELAAAKADNASVILEDFASSVEEVKADILATGVGLPSEFPEPGSTITATTANQWTLLGPGTYHQAVGGDIVVGEGRVKFVQWDGTKFDKEVEVEMPVVDSGKSNIFPFIAIPVDRLYRSTLDAIKELYISDYDASFSYHLLKFSRNITLSGDASNRYDFRVAKVDSGGINVDNYTFRKYLYIEKQSSMAILLISDDGLKWGYAIVDWSKFPEGYEINNVHSNENKLSKEIGDVKFSPIINSIKAFPFAKPQSDFALAYEAMDSIEELYLSDYDANFDYSLGTIARNYSGYWSIKIFKLQKGTNTIVARYLLEETNVPANNRVINLTLDGVIKGHIAVDWSRFPELQRFDVDPNAEYLLSSSIGNFNANPRIKVEIDKKTLATKTEVDIKIDEAVAEDRYAKKEEIPLGIITQAFADDRYAYKNAAAYNKGESDSRYAMVGSLSSSGNKFVDAADFGFLPSKTATENTIALQNALNGGRKTITVSLPGDYLLENTVYIDDNTTLILGAGVVLKKAAHYVFVLINRGSLTRTYNENITIEGLTINYNGYDQLITDTNSVHFGLRGFLTFWYVKNLVIKNYTCKNYSSGQWAMQIADFYNIIIDGVDISGHKDGIHLGRGKKFVIRNVTAECYDDTIALNCFDYPQSNPTIGDIEDGLIEMIDDYHNASWDNGSRFTLLLVGCPVAWRSGIPIRNGDAVTHGAKTFFALTGTTAGTDFISTTPPTAEFESAQTTSEGITWRLVDNTAVQSATIKNVTYRNIRHNAPTIGWFAWFMLEEDGQYTRTHHPELPSNKMPHVQNVNFENITSPLGIIKFQNKYKYSVNFKNINGRLGGSTLIIGEDNTGSRAVIDTCELRSDDNLWLGKGVDYVIRDCYSNSTPNISISGRLRTNVSINHGDLSQLVPEKGDEIIVNGVKKIYNGSSWIDLN